MDVCYELKYAVDGHCYGAPQRSYPNLITYSPSGTAISGLVIVLDECAAGGGDFQRYGSMPMGYYDI